MTQKKIYLKSILVIASICLVVGLLMAGVHALTQPVIDRNEAEKQRKTLAELFPEASGFTEVTDLPAGAPDGVTALWRTEKGDGYVAAFATNSGYGTSTFMVGVNADGTVRGLCTVSYGDSVSFGDGFVGEFAGRDAAGLDLISSASPAKYTRKAVKDAVSGILGWLAQSGCVKGGA